MSDVERLSVGEAMAVGLLLLFAVVWTAGGVYAFRTGEDRAAERTEERTEKDEDIDGWAALLELGIILGPPVWAMVVVHNLVVED